MDNPLVTVITPSLNQGRFVEATIKSVLGQTYQNIQYIFADGGSTDETMDIVAKYKSRIDTVIHEKDKGQSDAINKGFKLAKGELAGWINSDDLLYPDCIQRVVDMYRKNPDGAVFYSGSINHIDAGGSVLDVFSRHISSRRDLLCRDYNVIQPTSFYRMNFLRQSGFLNESLYYCMDLDLYLKLLNYGPACFDTGGPMGALRVWEQTKTANGKIRFLNEIRKTLLEHGAPWFSRNIRRTWWYSFKSFVAQNLPIPAR